MVETPGASNRPIRPGGNNGLLLLLLVVVLLAAGASWFFAKRPTGKENQDLAKGPVTKQEQQPSSWIAESLPITKTAGGLEVQLKGVTYQTVRTKNPRTGEISVNNLILPNVSFRDPGSAGGWKVLEEVTFDSKTPSRAGGQYHDLDRFAVWRMVIRAVKLPGANFSDEQMITTDWLEPVAAGNSATVNREFSNGLSTTVLTSMHGASAEEESALNGGMTKEPWESKRKVTLKSRGMSFTFTTDGPYFVFENVKSTKPFQLGVFAKDQDGRDLDAQVAIKGDLTVVMTKPSNTPFRITFVLKEIRETEFFLSPTDELVEFKTVER